MFFETGKNDLSSINSNLESSVNDDEKKENEFKGSFIVESGDKFINSFSMFFKAFMGIMNWIMKNAYLIAVVIVVVLLIVKANS